MHLEGLTLHARAGLQIDQSVVHGAAADVIGHAPAHVDGVMARITIREWTSASPEPERRRLASCATAIPAVSEEHGDCHGARSAADSLRRGLLIEKP